MKRYKIILLILSVIILMIAAPLVSYAGNNDSLPSYGYSGKGDDKWKYNSNYSGMRISIYWAPDTDAFVSGEGVIQLGKTTDVSNTGPWYKVDMYTGFSVYWYMNHGNMIRGSEFNPTLSINIPYTGSDTATAPKFNT